MTTEKVRNHELEEESLAALRFALPRKWTIHEFRRDYATFNAAYASYFPNDRRPARTCIGVTALARDACVEIDLVLRRDLAIVPVTIER